MSIANLFFPNDYKIYCETINLSNLDGVNGTFLNIGFNSSSIHIGDTGTPQVYINEKMFPQEFNFSGAGPTGPTGPAGPVVIGNTGSTGPIGITGPYGPNIGGVTGPIGITGTNQSPGKTGATGAFISLPAYGSASNRSISNPVTIVANGNMVFDIGSSGTPVLNITAPFPLNQNFTIQQTGKYFYQIYMLGVPNVNVPVTFGLSVNSNTPETEHQFLSNLNTLGVSNYIVNGHGIINLNAGDQITLRNRTGSGTVSVSFYNDNGPANNVKFSLIKID